MVKLICFVKHNAALSVDEFHARWRALHAPLVRDTPAVRHYVLRYEQNHRLPRDYARGGEFDGVAIQWFASMRDFVAMISDERYQETVGADERELLDLDGLVFLMTEPEEVVIPGPAQRPRGTVKLMCLLTRRPGLDIDGFHRHWREVHGPLNRDTPSMARHLLRYEQNHRARKDYERDHDYDGVTVEWFRSAREFFAMTAEPEYGAVVAPDERRFLDLDRLVWLLTGPEETIIG